MSFAEALVGFDNIAAGDADPAGANYTRSAVDSLRRAKGRCRVVGWPDETPKKWDVTDQLRRGGLESLLALVREPPTVYEVTTAPHAETDVLPMLPDSCWRPGFVAFRAAYARCTEASDAYIWGAYAVAGGLVLGRRARLQCGVEVYPNIYATNVGPSGRARKTTPQGFMRRLIPRVDESIEISHGIGSPEGLLELLSSEEAFPRRALVDVNELSTLLCKGAAEATRGLPALLNTLFDCPPSARLPNRKSDLKAMEPFLCVYASTTGEWLRRDITEHDVRGGLAGRFWYLVGQVKDPIPFPPPPNLEALEEAERLLLEAMLRHAEPREYPLSSGARTLWRDWYLAERSRAYPSLILECLAQRLHLHAWKAALLFAAIEGTDEITLDQLRAGCEFADYQRAAQDAVFRGLGDSTRIETERRVKEALRRHGDLAGWEIQQKVRHVDAQNLAWTLSSMGRLGTIEERKRGKGKVWHLMETA